MSRQSPHLDSRDRDRVHQEKVIAKVQKIDGLRALLEEWEAYPDHDYAYILELRAKLRSAVNQLQAMQGDLL